MSRAAIQGKRGLAILTSLLLLSAWPLPARDFFLQEGTEIPLRLHTTVDTKISQKGDRIIATVEEPVMIDNLEVIPVGSRVLGRIGDIRKPGRLGRGARMVLTFDSIEVPGAGNVKISGSLVDIYDPEYEEYHTDQEMKEIKDLDIGKEGQVKAGGPRKLKRAAPLGAGAGVGVAAGGGAGAAIGVAAGAIVAFGWFKGKHVELPAGSGLVMRVDRGVTLSVPDMPQTAGDGSKGKR